MPRLQGLWLSRLQGLWMPRVRLPWLRVTRRCTFDG
jgi:hypothetical protein